jgi:hypothetical protein
MYNPEGLNRENDFPISPIFSRYLNEVARKKERKGKKVYA